jgi:hypothetical protein
MLFGFEEAGMDVPQPATNDMSFRFALLSLLPFAIGTCATSHWEACHPLLISRFRICKTQSW